MIRRTREHFYYWEYLKPYEDAFHSLKQQAYEEMHQALLIALELEENQYEPIFPLTKESSARPVTEFLTESFLTTLISSCLLEAVTQETKLFSQVYGHRKPPETNSLLWSLLRLSALTITSRVALANLNKISQKQIPPHLLFKGPIPLTKLTKNTLLLKSGVIIIAAKGILRIDPRLQQISDVIQARSELPSAIRQQLKKHDLLKLVLELERQELEKAIKGCSELFSKDNLPYEQIDPVAIQQINGITGCPILLVVKRDDQAPLQDVLSLDGNFFQSYLTLNIANIEFPQFCKEITAFSSFPPMLVYPPLLETDQLRYLPLHETWHTIVNLLAKPHNNTPWLEAIPLTMSGELDNYCKNIFPKITNTKTPSYQELTTLTSIDKQYPLFLLWAHWLTEKLYPGESSSPQRRMALLLTQIYQLLQKQSVPVLAPALVHAKGLIWEQIIDEWKRVKIMEQANRLFYNS